MKGRTIELRDEDAVSDHRSGNQNAASLKSFGLRN